MTEGSQKMDAVHSDEAVMEGRIKGASCTDSEGNQLPIFRDGDGRRSGL